MYAYGETVTIQRASTVEDAYGDPVPGVWTDHGTYDGCAIWPTSSTEDNIARSEVFTVLQLVLPPDSDVLASDRAVWRGSTYEVVGDPFNWVNPLTGWKPGVQAQIRRVAG